MKKKIFFILLSMSGGGAERVAIEILNNLDKERYEPTLILFNKEGEFLAEVPKGLEIVNISKSNKLDFFKIIIRLRREIIFKRPEIIISFLSYPNIVAAITGRLVFPRLKIILTEHSDPRLEFVCGALIKFKYLLMRFAYIAADRIVAVSSGLANVLVDTFKASRKKVKVVHNPIDIDRVECMKKCEPSHRFFMHARQNPVIITAGRLSKEKNHKILLMAFSKVCLKRPSLLIILGQGALKDELQGLARDLRIEDRVDFVGFQNNPYAWVSRADLFVLSSNIEGFGNTIIEAMACGTPVISTDCAFGPREIITNGINGILVRPNDAGALSEAMLTLLEDEMLRKRLASAALDRSKDFDVRKVVLEYEELL